MSQTTSPVPGGSPPAPDPTAAPPADDSNVLVTITSDGQGGFMVYSGDEPEGDESGDMSGDDAAAMGPSGDMPAPQGQPADSVGAALKATMTILQSASSGGPEDAQSQFAAGFGGGGAAPSSMAQKL